jgi:hypothetical protein
MSNSRLTVEQCRKVSRAYSDPQLGPRGSALSAVMTEGLDWAANLSNSVT